MTSIGLVGAGAMGAALAANWIAGGAQVRTVTAGRGAATVRRVADAGIETVASLDEVVTADLVVSVVPPGQAVAVADDLAAAASRLGVTPLVADLNAVSPATLTAIAERVPALIDGSISGGPPRANRPVRVYVCGDRAAEFLEIPAPWLDIVRLDGPVGTASGLKMCTASMYKGTKALIMQALLTAESLGVREEFLADVSRAWPEDVPHWHTDVAVAAAKAWRFVDEMYEIAATQQAAGLPAELFEGVAAAYARAATTELGGTALDDLDPAASADEILRHLHNG